MNIITKEEAMQMHKLEIEALLRLIKNELMESGFDNVKASEIISTVMNLGIAAQVRWDEGER